MKRTLVNTYQSPSIYEDYRFIPEILCDAVNEGYIKCGLKPHVSKHRFLVKGGLYINFIDLLNTLKDMSSPIIKGKIENFIIELKKYENRRLIEIPVQECIDVKNQTLNIIRKNTFKDMYSEIYKEKIENFIKNIKKYEKNT